MELAGEQIRAARAMLRMGQATLASKAGVSVETIKRLERSDGVSRAQEGTFEVIRNVFETNGLLFVGGGVRRAIHPHARVIAAIAVRAERTVRAVLERAVKADPEFFNKGVEHVANRLVRSFEPEWMKNLVRRAWPSDQKTD